MAAKPKLAESGPASEVPVEVPVPDAAAPASPAAPEPAPEPAAKPVVAAANAPSASQPPAAPEATPEMVVIDVLSPIDDGTRHEIGEQMVVTPAAARELVAAGAAAYATE